MFTLFSIQTNKINTKAFIRSINIFKKCVLYADASLSQLFQKISETKNFIQRYIYHYEKKNRSFRLCKKFNNIKETNFKIFIMIKKIFIKACTDNCQIRLNKKK